MPTKWSHGPSTGAPQPYLRGAVMMVVQYVHAMRIYLVVMIGLLVAVFAVAPALAASPYRVTTMSLGYKAGESQWFPSDPEETIFNVTSPLVLTVQVAGPANGRSIRRLEIKVSGVGCHSNCQDKSWSVKIPRLGSEGSAYRRIKTPPWGCGHPVIKARLALNSGAHSQWKRWKPRTFCGE